MLAIDPTLFGDLQGSADTEVVFHLTLTFWLERDPVGALERAVEFLVLFALLTESDEFLTLLRLGMAGGVCRACRLPEARPVSRYARTGVARAETAVLACIHALDSLPIEGRLNRCR